MRTYSSFLQFLFTVSSFVICGFSAAALDDKNATTSPNNERKVKGSRNYIQESPTVSGAYIVRLDDKTSAAKTKATAIGTATMMQTMQQQLIADGVIQDTTNGVINIPPDRIYTKSIQGFLITGVPGAMVSSLLQIPGVIYVQPDSILSINSEVKSDSTTTKDQSGLRGIRSMQVVQQTPWGVTRVGGPIDLNTVPNPNAKIFVIDTGISTKTNDLNIDKSLSINFVGVDQGVSPTSWDDDNGHGTHVAGIIAALNNGINVVGMVPGASVVAVKVLDENGIGRMSDVIAGIEHVYINGKKGDVVNMSLGGISYNPPYVANAAVENTASLGIKFAIAAGNNAMDAKDVTPASAAGPNVFTVSCYDEADNLCSFSNFGKVVDYGGPGLNILSLSKDGGVATLSGTSMSAPHIAGLLFANSLMTDGFVIGDKDAYPDPIAVYAGDIPTPAPTGASNNLRFFILPDFYSGKETSWVLKRNSPGPPVVVSSVGRGTYPFIGPDNGWITFVSNLTVGSYRFDLYDRFGDGLDPPAYYILSLENGILLKSGGSFTNVDTTFFRITSGSSSVKYVTTVTKKSALAAAP